MGKGLLGLLKLHLIAKVQFCQFTTGPDLSNRGVFFKAALPSPDVEKRDQDGLHCTKFEIYLTLHRT